MQGGPRGIGGLQGMKKAGALLASILPHGAGELLLLLGSYLLFNSWPMAWVPSYLYGNSMEPWWRSNRTDYGWAEITRGVPQLRDASRTRGHHADMRHESVVPLGA